VILIQFGHNDQPGKGPERESAADGAYREHLRRYVAEAREAGALPVLVTPLTRRRWSADGRIEPTLAEYAAAAQAVAAETQASLIDLHTASIRQCEQMGAEAFRAFEPMLLTGADHTHLNAAGGRAVAALVVDILRERFLVLDGLPDSERISAVWNSWNSDAGTLP
jgi:pectinesterase